eukprot:19963-Eustigmatos_ZCMA.PRE.1
MSTIVEQSGTVAESVKAAIVASGPIPTVFGSLAWKPHTSTVDSQCHVSLYSTSRSALVTALQLTPSNAVFSGTLQAPGGLVFGSGTR